MSEQTSSLVGAATDLGRKLIGALPPAFIMLVLINCGFLGIVLWFLDAQLERRTALLNRIFDFCLQHAK